MSYNLQYGALLTFGSWDARGCLNGRVRQIWNNKTTLPYRSEQGIFLSCGTFCCILCMSQLFAFVRFCVFAIIRANFPLICTLFSLFCQFSCIYEKNVVFLHSVLKNCGVSTSVVHWLPKPRRRVRFPYTAPSRSVCRARKCEESPGSIEHHSG